MNKELITSVLTLRIIGEYNVKDNSDAMRVNMLAIELSNGNHTTESIKNTIGYRTCASNFNFTDEYLQELINQVNELKV